MPRHFIRNALAQAEKPVILHWLGDMFDPALAGYWGNDAFEQSMACCLRVMEENAARIDGTTRLGALFRVVMPLARSGVAATAVLIAVSAWNEFLFALMLTNSEGSRTWPVGLQLMVGEFQLPWGLMAAGGMISIIPIIIFFSFAQKALVRGLMVGAVKG